MVGEAHDATADADRGEGHRREGHGRQHRRRIGEAEVDSDERGKGERIGPWMKAWIAPEVIAP